MIQHLVYLRAALDDVYPGLSNAAIGAIAVLVVWLLKKFAPAQFAKLPTSLQALPAMLVSGVVAALAATEPTLASVLSTALGGALIGGTTAVGIHRVLKESPLPYGEPPDRKTPSIPVHITIVLVCFAVFAHCGLITTLEACTPAQRQALALPVVSEVDAVAMTLRQAVDWAGAHGVNPEAVQDARHVIETHDLPTAVELAKRLLEASADAGEQVPPELVALVLVAEKAIAAGVVGDAMRSLSTPSPSAEPAK